VLVYRPRHSNRTVQLAVCHDPIVTLEAARATLRELDSASTSEVDPVLVLEHELEAEKVRQILYAVLPALNQKSSSIAVQ